VGVHRSVVIYSIDTEGVEYTIDSKAGPNCLAFLITDTVVVGGESSTAQKHTFVREEKLEGAHYKGQVHAYVMGEDVGDAQQL